MIARFLFKVGLKRLALRPFTFSNAVTIPAGTLLALMPTKKYTRTHMGLTAFQFFMLREKDRDSFLEIRHQFVITSPELLGFGLGQYAW